MKHPTKRQQTAALIFALFIPFFAINAHSETLEFEIRKQSNINPYQVAIVPFLGNNTSGGTVANVIGSDLNFTELKATSNNLPDGNTVSEFAANRAAWQAAGIDYVVFGEIRAAGQGKATIFFDVVETATGRVIDGRQSQLIDADAAGLRFGAHVVSDRVYELITGEKGDFSGRIAYIEETGDPRQKTSTLNIMDADGQNARAVFSVQGSIFSPAWSPDGRTLAYSVQRPNGLPVIYTQNVDGGEQTLVTPFKGNNLGASFAPDGQSILFSGSHENNDPAIYELHLGSKRATKLTPMTGAENSPSFAPDGRSFVFTADNGSRTPQLYSYDIGTRSARRLGAGAAYNPRISKDGQKIAYVSGGNLAVVGIDGSGMVRIGAASPHESASFSPNSTRLVFASPQGITFYNLKTGQLFTKTGTGRIREPVWSNGAR